MHVGFASLDVVVQVVTKLAKGRNAGFCLAIPVPFLRPIATLHYSLFNDSYSISKKLDDFILKSFEYTCAHSAVH